MADTAPASGAQAAAAGAKAGAGAAKARPVDPYGIIMHPYVTEKTMNQMDRENKLEFVVRRTASKDEIRKAIEALFEVKVETINTKITKRGKKAIVRFGKDYKAEEIGMRIGVF